MPHYNLLDAFFLETGDVLDVCAAVEHEVSRRCVTVAVLVGCEDGGAAEGEGVHAQGEVESFVADEAGGLGPEAAAGADCRDGGFGDGVGEEGVVGDWSGGEHFIGVPLFFFSSSSSFR